MHTNCIQADLVVVQNNLWSEYILNVLIIRRTYLTTRYIYCGDVIFKDVTEFTYGVCKVFPFKNVSWRQCVFSPLRDQSFCLVGCSVNKVSQFTASASNSHVVSTHLIAQTPTIYSYLFRKTSSYYFSVLISLSFIPLDPCNHYLNDSSQYYNYHDQNTPNCLQNVCKFHYIIFI